MNLQQVLSVMGLPWQATGLGNEKHLLAHPDCLGSIVLDEKAQIIFPASQRTPSSEQIDKDLKFYTDPRHFIKLDSTRILQCEDNALSNFKKPGRYFPNIFKLFEGMVENEENGTVAVFGHFYQDLDGKYKWSWIRVEWDDRYETLAWFEKIIADFNSAIEASDEEKIVRAENMLKYLTGANWSRSDKVLQVGKLSDGVGWQWLTDSSLCNEDQLDDYGGDVECDVVRCTCDFSQSIAWGLGYTGQYIAEMHRAYQIHKEERPDCQDNLS